MSVSIGNNGKICEGNQTNINCFLEEAVDMAEAKVEAVDMQGGVRSCRNRSQGFRILHARRVLSCTRRLTYHTMMYSTKNKFNKLI